MNIILNLFSPKGKYTRLPFFIIVFIIVFINFLLKRYSSVIEPSLGIIILLIMLVVYVFSILKRLRDLGWSLWLTLILFIPYISYVFLLVLICTEGENINQPINTNDNNFIETNVISQESDKKQVYSLKEIVSNILPVIFYLSYLGLGLLQIIATFSGVKDVIQNTFFALIVTSIVAYIPVVGTVFGILGAHNSWGWNWAHAILLFTFPYIIIFTIMILSAISEIIVSKFTR